MPSPSSSRNKKEANSVVAIKIEPRDVKPLGEFVSDRVELIRQTFSCLKGKVIKSMCPGFLQGKTMDEIQEQCLDEVLGISTKRLLSIINATKCPENTESSSDDSDVEKIIEHISLDEISSDEEISKAAKSKAAARKRKNSKKENGEKVAKNPKVGETSVLELLELQARARAIRSQLALEPITKIELNSDQDSSSESESECVIKPQNSTATKATSIQSQSSVENELQPKRVKLNRNFRKRQVEDDESMDQDPPAPVEQKSHAEKESSAVKQEEEKNDKDRCESPDIITVVPSPETFCILDSDEEEEEQPATTPKVNTPDPPEDEKVSDESVEDGEITEEPVVAPEKPTNDESILQTPENNEESSHDGITPAEEPKIKPTYDDDDMLTVDLAHEELNYSESSDDEPAPPPPQEQPVEEPSEIETVDLDDSSNELPPEAKAEEGDSFHARWLGSKKVSKILATSRLGNRLRRDKINAKKSAVVKSDSENSNPAAPIEEPPAPVDVEHEKFEEGSVQQYKVLHSKTVEADDEIAPENVENAGEKEEQQIQIKNAN